MRKRYFASTLSLNFRIFVKNKNSFLKKKKVLMRMTEKKYLVFD